MPFDDKAATINALISAVEAIESELGLLPSGVYASVRTRLDILEARINNPLAPAPNVQNPFFIGDTGVTISTGYGAPTESRVPGSIFLREDGYNDQGLYAFRPDGYWHQIDTDPWTAAGDLAGNIYSQTVIGIQGRPVKATAPQIDLEGDGYVLTWGADGYWEPQIGFYAAGDLTGNKLSQTVVNLQGQPLMMGNPGDGYVLTWDAVDGYWTSERAAVVFDPLDSLSSTNLRSNRYGTQSPIDNTRMGIVNLGSDTVQTTTGVTGNYASNLGGDQNQVNADLSSVVGGLSNSVVNLYSGILGGDANIVSGAYASVVGGQLNASNMDYSFVGGGGNNQINGTGTNNVIAGGISISITGTTTYSSVLGGNTNAISSSNNAVILGGVSNFMTLNSDYGFMGSGSHNEIFNAKFAAILQGNVNFTQSDYSLILTGINNDVGTTGQFSITSGNNNQNNSYSSVVIGDSNLIPVPTSQFAFVIGDNNQGTGAIYGAIFGSTNTVTDGYVLVNGFENTTNLGATYSLIMGNGNFSGGTADDIHGYSNVTGSGGYASVWGGSNNIFDNSPYCSIFGASNTIANSSQYGFIVGNGNQITAGSYAGAWGANLTVNGNYSNVWGSSSTVQGQYSSAFGSFNNLSSSNYSNAWGYRNNLGADYTNIFGNYNSGFGTASFAHGQYALTDKSGQYSHSNASFDGTTVGTGQFSRMVLIGNGPSGSSITFTTDGVSGTVTTQAGKSYDMDIRILVSDTVAAGVCARYVFSVLAHNEGGTLTIDRVDAENLNDNGTSWVGNNWTSIFSGVSGALNITLPSSGSNTRRAVATIEWRELLRN